MKTDNQAAEIANSRRPWLRGLTYLAIVLFPGLTLLISRQGWRHTQAIKNLQATLTDMDRAESGWRLEDIEAARETIPDRENSARVIVAASKLLPKLWPAQEFSDLFAPLRPEQQLPAGEFARLKQELDKVRAALVEARRLTAMPRGRHHLQYKPFVLETQLTDQQETRRIVSLLCYDALRHAQERDMISALNSCRAAFHAANSLGDEPSPISQSLRMDGVIQSCQNIERVLAQGEPVPERLAEFQDLLRREDDFPDQLIFARGTRAILHSVFDALESGIVPLSKLEGVLPPKFNPFFDALPSRENLRQSHPAMLAAMSRYVAIARLPMREQAAALKQFDLELSRLKQSDPLAVNLIPALENTFKYSQRKHAYLRCLSTALAAECYRQKHSHWPESLDKLCPQFLVFVPRDPFDGKALRYRRVANGVIIYSVSSEQADNNGNLARAQPNSPGVAVAVRLWDATERRQPPRLQPR